MAIVRRSKKRDAILRVMRNTKCHPSADWIYQQLRDEYPNLSLGTVYRNLNQLSEEHVIRRVGVINGQERFDADTRPHAHFVCNCCGTVLDLPDYAPPRHYIQSLSTQYGFTAQAHEFNLRGLCSDCKKNITLEETVS